MVQIASGLFIWAATACRFIEERKRFAARRLNSVLQGSSSAPTAPEKHLDEIYTTVLKQSVPEEFTKEEREEASFMLRRILGSIITLSSPLSALSLSRLLCVTKGDIDQTLDDLHSILDVPEDETDPFVSITLHSETSSSIKRDAQIRISGWTRSKRIRPWLKAVFGLCRPPSSKTSVV